MFDESIWNQPFPFDSGPANPTIQPGHDEFLDLLDDTFLDDGMKFSSCKILRIAVV